MSASVVMEPPREAAVWCRTLVKRRAGNFYWGLRLLPEPRRTALYAVYAWMRRADDIADDADDPDLAMAMLDDFESATLDVLRGGEPGPEPMWLALQWLAQSWDLPERAFVDMIRGQRDDLASRVIETEEDLLDYCRCVASTVGELCITIWGYTGDAAPELAVERGIALQLTNILRDIGDDAARGRCYIPAEDLRKHGIDASALATWRDERACESVVRTWIQRAERAYATSAPLDDLVSPDCRRTLCAMTGVYRELLRRLAAHPHACCGVPGVALSTLTKLRIMLSAGRRRS
ncbi:MAG: phytoene/squalene synthase family protein [Phycisphaerales bacterium]|jgi:phytoene synthase|nr:phytoene/squalene synthase family protein [Phycisphaerales bacterium]